MKFGKPDWALPRTSIFAGGAMSPFDPNSQYVRIENIKEKMRYGIWFKGQVTEASPIDIEPTCPLSLFYKVRPGTGGGAQAVRYDIWINSGCVGSFCDGSITTPAFSEGSDGPPEVPRGWKIATEGKGLVWAEVTIDQEEGKIADNGVKFAKGDTLPEDPDDGTKKHLLIGRFNYLSSNEPGPPEIPYAGGGTINITICRNWWASESPFFGVNLEQCCCGGGGGGGSAGGY